MSPRAKPLCHILRGKSSVATATFFAQFEDDVSIVRVPVDTRASGALGTLLLAISELDPTFAVRHAEAIGAFTER